MRLNKHVYINGSRKKQLEIVKYLTTDEPREFGDLWSLSIGLKIEVIRTCVCYTESKLCNKTCNKDISPLANHGKLYYNQSEVSI